MQVSSHSVADDFTFDTILLCGEGESHRSGIVELHSSHTFMCKCVGPFAQGDILQAEGGVLSTERVLAWSTQEKESNADHVSDGKHVILHVIGSVSVMQNGAHNCNGNRLHTFGWRNLFGVPSKLLTESEVNVSVAVHLDIWDPIRLHAWPTACKVSETEPDCTGLRLVVRRPSWILWPKTCMHGTKSVDVSWGSKECVAQKSN